MQYNPVAFLPLCRIAYAYLACLKLSMNSEFKQNVFDKIIFMPHTATTVCAFQSASVDKAHSNNNMMAQTYQSGFANVGTTHSVTLQLSRWKEKEKKRTIRSLQCKVCNTQEKGLLTPFWGGILIRHGAFGVTPISSFGCHCK